MNTLSSNVIDSVVIDPRAADLPLAQRILANWKGAAPQLIDDRETLLARVVRQADPLAVGKRTLFVTCRKGRFLTFCQGMTERHRTCCNYRVLNVEENCPLDCTYCILQHYLNNPLLVLHANLEDVQREVAQLAQSKPRNSLFRIGTGELGDSLALDRLTGLSLDLIRIVAPYENVVLELKTKTVEIENLLSIAAPPNVVVSWSLNTPRHIAAEETGAPSLDARLDAARRCQRHGYRVGIHFDPLIYSPGWETEYRTVVEAVFDSLDARQIPWISLGALRFPLAMKRMIRERFPRSAITGGELAVGWDGKLRYVRPMRVAMFRKMLEWIAERAPDATVYLCMESQEVWADVFGRAPRGAAEVAERLDAGYRKTKIAGHSMCAAD